MIAFKESPLVLTAGGISADEYRTRYPELFGIAAQYSVPLQVWAPVPEAVEAARTIAREQHADVIVAGVVSAPERAEGVDADVRDLAAAAPDLLYARVSGTVDELRRVGASMAKTGLPFVLAISLREDGSAWDGLSLAATIEELDKDPALRPWHYALGCVYASVARRGLESLFRSAPALAHRVVALDAYATDSEPKDFAAEVWDVAQTFGLHVVGGCCGASPAHMLELAKLATQNA